MAEIKLYADSRSSLKLEIDPNLKQFNGVYLHGRLQDIADYDIIFIDPKYINELMNKISDVKVVMLDGSEYDAIAFIWNRKLDSLNMYRGLVCAIDDEEHIKDARHKYNNRDLMI